MQKNILGIFLFITFLITACNPMKKEDAAYSKLEKIAKKTETTFNSMKSTSSEDFDFSKDLFIGQLEMIQYQLSSLKGFEKGKKDFEYNNKHYKEREIKNKLQDIVFLLYDANTSNSYEYFSSVANDPMISPRITDLIEQCRLNGKEVPLKARETPSSLNDSSINININTEFPEDVSK